VGGRRGGGGARGGGGGEEGLGVRLFVVLCLGGLGVCGWWVVCMGACISRGLFLHFFLSYLNSVFFSIMAVF